MLWVALYNQNEWFFKFYLLGPNGSPPCLIHAFVTLETKSMSFFSACESAPGDLFKAKIPLYSVHAKKAIHINYLSLKLIFIMQSPACISYFDTDPNQHLVATQQTWLILFPNQNWTDADVFPHTILVHLEPQMIAIRNKCTWFCFLICHFIVI